MEKTRLRIGFVPLCDSAPLVVARERGFFAEQGLEVELSPEPSWANIRDKLAIGQFDAAQMLATMPLSGTLGLGNMRVPLVTALALNSGGNAITLSNALLERMTLADPQAMAEHPTTARALKTVIVQDQSAGRPPLTLAMVYPFSTHHYELRYWLAAANIDPDRDVRLVVVPPTLMVSHLSGGQISGYCVGEPWNQLAVTMGLGRRVITSHEIWGGRMEKVLAVHQDWAERNPTSHQAMIRALLLACRWIDAPQNRAETADILAQPHYLNAPLSVVRTALERTAELSFHHGAANFPWRSQALWYLSQMRRWGQLSGNLDAKGLVARIYRTDLYRQAAESLNIACPLADEKIEGGHDAPWQLEALPQSIAMAADRPLDGCSFEGIAYF